MRRGWEVELDDGNILNESMLSWKDVPKVRIKRLTLRYDGREWNLQNKPAYFQKKRAYIIPGIDNMFIDARSIGYYDIESECKVWYTVDENTGIMKMEID